MPLARVDLMLKNFEERREKGLFGAHLGVESLNQDTLDDADKKLDQTKTLSLLSLMSKHNMLVQAFYMIGFEDETVESSCSSPRAVRCVRGPRYLATTGPSASAPTVCATQRARSRRRCVRTTPATSADSTQHVAGASAAGTGTRRPRSSRRDRRSPQRSRFSRRLEVPGSDARRSRCSRKVRPCGADSRRAAPALTPLADFDSARSVSNHGRLFSRRL